MSISKIDTVGVCAVHSQESPDEAPTRVLLVEDCEPVLNVISLVLRRTGHHVIATSDGEEAVVLFEREGPFDLMLTDVVLPGRLCGYQIAERLRQIAPTLPIIFFTGHSMSTVALEKGFTPDIQHLVKPAMISEIRDAVSAALRQC